MTRLACAAGIWSRATRVILPPAIPTEPVNRAPPDPSMIVALARTRSYCWACAAAEKTSVAAARVPPLARRFVRAPRFPARPPSTTGLSRARVAVALPCARGAQRQLQRTAPGPARQYLAGSAPRRRPGDLGVRHGHRDLQHSP